MELTTMKVTCLMESSVDGRIDESRWSLLYDAKGEGSPDVYIETKNQIEPELTIIGRGTVLKHFCNQPFESKSHTKIACPKPFLAMRTKAQITAVFDSYGTIAYESSEIIGTNLLIILGSDCASQEYLDYLESKEIAYTFAGSDGHDVKKALKSLYSDFGIKNVLLSGGGILNGAFLKQRLIDELYLVLYPGIDGHSKVSCVFEDQSIDGKSPASGQSLELISCQVKRAGVIVIHYRFHYY